MTDSQKWSIWILVVTVGLLAAAWVGVAWFFIAVYVIGRLVIRIAVLVCVAGALSSRHSRR
jgi:hypothetical protein